jgi:molybdate transport system permease protein
VTSGVVSAVLLSLQVAAVGTVVVMAIAVPLAYLLARREFFGKRVLTSLLILPMVLPPTAIGYLLLVLLGDRGWLGRETLGFDLGLLFTWRAATVAAAVMAFPLVVRTVQVTFEAIDPRLEWMARTLGRGPLETFATVTLPLASRGLLAAAILGFMRGLGEFGATVMIAGNIPGRTQTLALAIFGAQQAGNDAEAMVLLVIAVAVGFVALYVADGLTRRVSRPHSESSGECRGRPDVGS